jgi:hypothetical protein
MDRLWKVAKQTSDLRSHTHQVAKQTTAQRSALRQLPGQDMALYSYGSPPTRTHARSSKQHNIEMHRRKSTSSHADTYIHPFGAAISPRKDCSAVKFSLASPGTGMLTSHYASPCALSPGTRALSFLACHYPLPLPPLPSPLPPPPSPISSTRLCQKVLQARPRATVPGEAHCVLVAPSMARSRPVGGCKA